MSRPRTKLLPLAPGATPTDAHFRRLLAWLEELSGGGNGPTWDDEVVARIKRNGGIGPVKGKVYGTLKKCGEYDGAVVDGESALVLGVERKLLLKHVREFVGRRLPRFAEDFPDLAAGRKVYGALVFESEGDKGQSVKLARENGLLLVRAGKGKRMKVLNPDLSALRPIAG